VINMSRVGKYGLPLEVRFCKKCTISNQRPSSTVEFRSTIDSKKETISFGVDGICDACRYVEYKKTINWEDREKELLQLCDRFRRNDGRYDVIVPGSGGKDSLYVAHLLKYKYNMHPLCVTWPPHMYTENGYKNFTKWLEAGFPNITYWPNQKVHKILTRLAFKNLLHPFQPFIIGQRNIGPMFSVLLDIPLIMYGENQAEYGNKIKENQNPKMNSSFFSSQTEITEINLGGVSLPQIMEEYNLSLSDLKAYIPTSPDLIEKTGTEVHYMSYYVKWHPQEVYYYGVTNTGFRPNTKRTEGSYSKYSSIDDKLDWLHYYTTYIKFGIGRATYDSSQEIRNGDITRDEGVYLVQRFDGEFPAEYLADILDYLDISLSEFEEIINLGRPDHLWEKSGDKWKLKHKISF
jgi:N-acetyl sugar amidotransferase